MDSKASSAEVSRQESAPVRLRDRFFSERQLRYSKRILGVLSAVFLFTLFSTYNEIRNSSPSDDIEDDYKTWLRAVDECQATGHYANTLNDRGQLGSAILPFAVATIGRIVHSSELCASQSPDILKFPAELVESLGMVQEQVFSQDQDIIQIFTLMNSEDKPEAILGLPSNGVLLSITHFSWGDDRQARILTTEQLTQIPDESLIAAIRVEDNEDNVMRTPVEFSNIEYRLSDPKRTILTIQQNGTINIATGGHIPQEVDQIESGVQLYYSVDLSKENLFDAIPSYVRHSLAERLHLEETESGLSGSGMNFIQGLGQTESGLVSVQFSPIALISPEAWKETRSILIEAGIQTVGLNDPKLSMTDYSPAYDHIPEVRDGLPTSGIDSDTIEELLSGKKTHRELLLDEPFYGYYLVITKTVLKNESSHLTPLQ